MTPEKHPINIPIAIASFVLSLILWLVVTTLVVTPTPMTWSLALTAQGLDTSKYLVVSEIPSSQTFFLKIAPEEVNQLGRQNPSGIIDLRNVLPGKRRYPIEVVPSTSRKFFPEGSLFVMLDIEPLMSRKIPVTLEANGQLPDPTLRLEQTVTDPEFVSVSGPKQDVQRVVKVRGILDLSRIQIGVREFYDVEVEALAEGNIPLPRVRLQPESIRVNPVFSPADDEKTVFVIPNIVGKPADGFAGISFTVDPPKVTVTGNSLDLAALSRLQTAKVNIDGLSSDLLTRVGLLLPKGVTTKTKEVTVSVKISPQSVGPTEPLPSSGPPPTNTTGQ